ncbi:hypothetical protein tb265_45020 [Gemmatimonadetes bacterium T265]|nr:hypothetical protein tb265_45020 [Gemmatimonadetes bacterium T265]
MSARNETPPGAASRAHFRRVDALLDAALDRDPADRAAFVDALAADDPAVGAEVRALLRADAEAGAFLDGPALADPLQARLQRALAGRYSLRGRIGSGGMARVYLADDVRHGRRVAIKAVGLPAHGGGDGSDVTAGGATPAARFLAEVRVMARLQHPHLLPLFDSGEADGVPYLVMPYVEGGTLRRRLAAEGPLPVAEAVRLTQAVAGALAHAHAAGVVHRDLKPENILLRDGEPLVADFGIAAALAGDATGEAVADAERLTRTGVVVGTPSYMSPEQSAGERHLDARSDVYALGTMLYEMLAGEPPFRGPSARAVIARRLSEAPPSVRARRPDVPEELDAVVLRALAPEPADRFASAAAFARALDALTAPSSGSAPMGAAAVTTAAAVGVRRARRRIGVAAAALVVAGGAWIAVAARAGPTAPRSIAVMPTDMGGDTAHSYLADGLSNDLTTRLSRVPGLVVRAYASSRALRDKPIADVGRAMRVSSVLTASLVRAGSRLRVTASLVDPATQSVQWSDTFEASDQDQFALQDKLVASIADALRLSLAPATREAVAARGTRSAEAHDFVQRSMFQADQFTPASLRSAVALAELAIQKDSAYGDAWAALANAWELLADDFVPPREALPHLRPAADRALALNPQSAEAHTQVGFVHLFYDYDVVEATRELRTALAIDSANANAGIWLARVLEADPRTAAEAAQIRERAFRLNPGSTLLSYYAIGRWSLRPLGDAQRRERCASAAALRPRDGARCEVGRLLLSGDTAAAMTLLRSPALAVRAGARGGFHATVAAWLYGFYGDTADARRELAIAVAESAHEYVREDDIAIAYFRVGDVERSIAWLRRAVASRSSNVVFVATESDFAPLRADPRVRALLAEAGVRVPGA